MVLFAIGLNTKMFGLRRLLGWIRVPCVKWRMSYLQFVVIFVCSKETKKDRDAG